MKQEKKPEAKAVILPKTGEIELPKIDVTKHIGKKVQIVNVEEYEGKHGYFVKMETEPVETIEKADKDVVIRGSAIFGLQQDAEGNIGWGKDTKLGLLLAKYKVKHYNDMKGKTVILQTKANDNGTEFLTFN